MMQDLAPALVGIVGQEGVLSDVSARERYETDWRKRLRGRAALIARPRSTAEVASVLRLCAERAVGVVPQGGNTGLCGGATPDESGQQIVLSTERLTRIREVDDLGNTMVAEAGCTIAALEARAAEVQRTFPLSFAAEGSAQIGGALATNAGGNAVVRYGCARELTLGLEVVLASGEVLGGLKALRKDNSGYDLKQLFIGSEGTLGIITAAALRLFPIPRTSLTGWAAVPSLDAGVRLLRHLQAAWGDNVTACELISAEALELVTSAFPDLRRPLHTEAPFHVLVEVASHAPAEEAFEQTLLDASVRELCIDATTARTAAAAALLWRLREEIPEAEKRRGPSVKHDVSLPHHALDEFVRRADEATARLLPGARVILFGHLGDGSLHYNVSLPARPQGWDPAVGPDYGTGLYEAVHGLAVRLGGSLSAEHGLGSLKAAHAALARGAIANDVMRTLKRALDPQGILNPGKVL